MSRLTRRTGTTPRVRSLGVVAALAGLPVALALVALCQQLPGVLPDGLRATCTAPPGVLALLLICAGAGVLVGKLLDARAEFGALATELLPPNEAQPRPLTEAPALRQSFNERCPFRLRDTLAARRVADLLDFVGEQRALAGFEARWRSLAEDDSYSCTRGLWLLRAIIAVLPLFGLVGAALVLAKDTPTETELDNVVGPLALAWVGAVVLWIGNMLLHRLHARVLDQVHDLVETELAHRFLAAPRDTEVTVEMLRQQTQVIAQAIQQAVDQALLRHGKLLAAKDHDALARHRELADTLNSLAQATRDNDAQQHVTLGRIVDQLGFQLDFLMRIHDPGKPELKLRAA
jgi:hypothetical protein